MHGGNLLKKEGVRSLTCVSSFLLACVLYCSCVHLMYLRPRGVGQVGSADVTGHCNAVRQAWMCF